MRVDEYQKSEPMHISQAFGINKEEHELDFFDANLRYDSRVFIDPFLLKRSSNRKEAELFSRFGDFFRYSYDLSLDLPNELDKINGLLTIHEPKELNMGYSKNSNAGSGPGPSLASKLVGFFLDSSAKRLVKETDAFPDDKYNPVSLEIFTDGLGPDGISDISANLFMDYFIEYTQEKADELGIPTRELPLDQDGYDFDEKEWRAGGHYRLPENPLRPGQALIFIPKRLLRGEADDNEAGVISDVLYLLRKDARLTQRFSDLVVKNIGDVAIEEVRKVFLQEKSIHRQYMELLEEKARAYDFLKDPLGLMAIKKYDGYFSKTTYLQPSICDDVLSLTQSLIAEFNKEFSERDGWRDAWQFIGNVPKKPNREVAIGRIFRAMGHAFFKAYPEVTFEAESGTGNGVLDFKIIWLDCRIAIEFKLIDNKSSTGKPSLPAYLHGIKRQLPHYIKILDASHGIYITGQHYSANYRPEKGHDARVADIKGSLGIVEKALRNDVRGFKNLQYINVDMTPRPSASKL